MKYVWEQGAWQDYLYWQSADRVIAQRLNALLKDIARNGNSGIGKPEQLRHGLQAQWSRRINEEHRLVYRISGDEIRISSCRYRYKITRQTKLNRSTVRPLG